MEHHIHNMSNLFAQLGKPNDEVSISCFVATYAPLPNDIRLHEASFWTIAQANFLSDSISDDADWAKVVDDLNSMLRCGR